MGIVDDVGDVALNRSPRPIMYVPAAQLPDGVKALSLPLLPVAWMIRMHGSPVTLRNAIQNELRLAGRGLPVARIRGLDEVAAESTAHTHERVVDDVLRLCGFVACVGRNIRVNGVFGRTAQAPERSPAGAGSFATCGSEAGGVRNRAAGNRGIAIGALSAGGLTRFLASLLYGVKPGDPVSFLAVPLVLGSVALVAA